MSVAHLKGTLLAALVVCIALGPVAADNVDPDDDGSQYAWAENAGWLNTQPSGMGGPGMEITDFDVQGWMWAENVGWISFSCENNASCNTVDYGIANDGHGTLSGFAWGENVGWINFSHDEGGVQIDPGSGELGGYAWSENLGWIGFSCTDPGACGATDYGVKTGWCQETPSSPTGGPDLRAARAGDDVELSQLTLDDDAAWHEIVRGSLSILRNSAGDFESATLDCAGDNVTGSTIVVPGSPDPVADDGYWYLARRVNCKGKGTFDSGGTGQSGSRDGEVAAAGVDCP